MRVVQQVAPHELEEIVTISANAYPGLDLGDRVKRARFRDRVVKLDRDPEVHFYALYEDDRIRGVMRWHDFTMNLLGTRALVGGLGGLAVDLLHKKEKVAADMIQAFLRHYKDAGASMAALYPFRPDFYHRMGFGYGTPIYHFRFQPASLPVGTSKAQVRFLGRSDAAALASCYQRYFERTHGLMVRPERYWTSLLEDHTLQKVGVERDGQLSGYLFFRFERGQPESFLNNNILLREMVADTPNDLSQLLSFLHSQDDQIGQIIYSVQDASFFYLLRDPRDISARVLPHVVYHESSTQGLGIMYRLLSMPRLLEVLEQHSFGAETCHLRLDLTDTFFPENAGSYFLNVRQGRARLMQKGDVDVSLGIDVAEFSSLVMGAVRLRSLVTYGLATVSDAVYLDRLDRLFRAPEPICLTSF